MNVQPTRPSDLTEAEPVPSEAVPGHNNPPPYDPKVVAELEKDVADFMSATQEWLDLDEITTEAQAGKIVDQIDGLRKKFKIVDDARKVTPDALLAGIANRETELDVIGDDDDVLQ